jgi:hypothetical protein
VITTSAEGLVVEPGGRNESTGAPAFAQPRGTDGKPEFLRWAALLNRTTPGGVNGIEMAPGHVMTGTTEFAVRTFGIPADADFRAGAASVMAIDRETGMVFDFVLTDTRVYALYERLAGPGRKHITFSYGVPVGTREPGRFHSCSVALDTAAGVARWLLAAALEEFAARGYAGARVQDIADRAGVNKQLINYYFGARRACTRGCARRGWSARAASPTRACHSPTSPSGI